MKKRKALGKGLSALIPEADGMDREGTSFFFCPVDSIEPNPEQPRKDLSGPEMAEMVQSIREKGIITPLLVSRKDEGYQLIAGERRWRAAQKAGLDRVPVVVREADSFELLELALIENIHRKDLNPIEEAMAYDKMLSMLGITQESLSKRLGKDRSTIANLLRLLKLPRSIQKDVIEGLLSTGHARVLAGLEGPGEQKALRDAIVEKSLSVREAEGLAKKRKNKGSGAKLGNRVEEDNYILGLENDLKASLGTKVALKRRGKKGRIEIYFHSDDELERLLELLS